MSYQENQTIGGSGLLRGYSPAQRDAQAGISAMPPKPGELTEAVDIYGKLVERLMEVVSLANDAVALVLAPSSPETNEKSCFAPMRSQLAGRVAGHNDKLQAVTAVLDDIVRRICL